MNHLTVKTRDAFSSLLEAAANNDNESFKQLVGDDSSGINEVGLWYVRKKGSKQMVFERRTPLMVAAMYGSVDVLKSILSHSITDVNRSCGDEKSTALHCAASGGSENAVDIVKLLLEAGADPNAVDDDGNRPFDVITVSPGQNDVKLVLEELLAGHGSVGDRILRVSTTTSNSNSNSPPLSSSSPGNGSPSSSLASPPSPMNMKFDDRQPNTSGSERKEYPIDPSLPDIKNSIYATDEFRMYSFKIRPCSRAYSHDWTECPFVHPGENARRRDPRKYHYSCVPCPDFRKEACRRGDMCEYAHGVFECWLHPAQYRTRLCKDGTDCARRVCFFAHTPEELRPLYVSTGSAVPSPRSNASNSMDFGAAMNFIPGSPSSLISPSSFTPPISPSAANGMSNAAALGWPRSDVPFLRLPGSNLQSSRLRSSLNARDLTTEEFEMLNEFSCLSMTPNSLSRSSRSNTLNPSNLHDLFSAEGSSPRYNDQTLASTLYSPTHKSTVFNQFQQGMLSPINTNFSPKGVEHSVFSRMSPRSVEPISPMSGRASMIAQREQQQQLHQSRSFSSRELGPNLGAIVGSPVHSWSRWGSSNGKPDWAVNTDETGKLRRSSSFELGNNDQEPDLSWVQTLVKESPTEIKERTTMSNSQIDVGDQSVIGSWIEHMEHDKVVARTTDNCFFGQ